MTVGTYFFFFFFFPSPTLRFSHFSRLHDVQMLAMLACVFQQHYNQSLKNQREAHQLSDQQQSYATSPPPTPAASPHLAGHPPHTPGSTHHPPHTPGSAHQALHATASTHQAPHATASFHHPAGSTHQVPNMAGSAHQTPHTARLNSSPPKKVQQGQQQVVSPSSPISSSWHNVQLDSNGNGEQHFMEIEEQHDQQCRWVWLVTLWQHANGVP